MFVFTFAEDEKLVNSVSKFPCIYDVKSKLYKNHVVKDNAWREISECVEKSAEDCKKRWRNIKDTFLKRQKRGKSSAIQKPWPLSDKLFFLVRVKDERSSISNICDEDSFTQEDEMYANYTVAEEVEPRQPQSSSKSSTSSDELLFREQNEKVISFLEERRKERNDILRELAQNCDDETDLFFKSIAMSVKKLRPELIHEAKIKSLNLVYELQNRNSSFMNFS